VLKVKIFSIFFFVMKLVHEMRHWNALFLIFTSLIVSYIEAARYHVVSHMNQEQVIV
jgi:hypothetical protein